MAKSQWAIAPSDLAVIEGIFSDNALTGTPMFCYTEDPGRWEVYEATGVGTFGSLVAYLCTTADSGGWVVV